MKKCVLVFLALCLTVGSLLSQTIDRNAQDGAIYVKFKDNVDLLFRTKAGIADPSSVDVLSGLTKKYGVTSVRNTFWQTNSDELHRVFKITFENASMVNDFIKDLENNESIEYAEKAPYFYVKFTPNDANYATVANRWHLDKVNATAAWDISHGNANIKIAIIDNAIDWNHPELVNKIYKKIDLADGDDDPTPPATDVVWSHGTHTSGLAAAATNNGIGTASLAFDVSLIAIKAGKDADGGNGASAMFEGITWAADNGANVISLSLGGPTFFQTMQMVIDYAYNKGIVIVAAGGNNGNGDEDANNINYIGYPAACDHVIAVGATNGNDVAASFSEYGTWIDVMAPGGYQNGETYISFLNMYLPSGPAVYSLGYDDTYTTMQGTSMACPIVASLCGLMLSVDSNLTPDRVTQFVKATCDNIESLQNTAHQGKVGSGRINAFKAVKMVQDSMSTVYAQFTANTNYIPVGGFVNFTDQTAGTATSWNWTFEGATPSSSTLQNPTAINYTTAGSFAVTLTVSDGVNSSTETKTKYITVQNSASSAWIEQASGFSAMYRGAYDVCIVDANTAWSTAIDGTSGAAVNEFTKTTDGGTTWVPGTISAPAGYAPANISAISATNAWVSLYPTSGAGGKVYVTADGGATWTHQTTATFANSASFLNVLHFFNANDGFCMGDPINSEFEIYTTNNGGATWTLVPGANIPAPLSGEMGWTSIYDASGDIVWFGTNKGRIFKSIDKGLNWTVLTTGLTDISKVTFNDEMNGIAQQITYNTSTGAITAFNMKKTINGGTTWTTVTPAGSIWKGDIDGIPGVAGKYYSVGSDGAASSSAKYGSSYSLDYGATWLPIDTGIQYISVKFLDNTLGWAGGFSINATQSGIYKWDNTVGIENNVIESGVITLYPNPSNGIVNIKGIENANVKVYNLVGGLVYEKSNFSSGVIDLSFLSKGIYIAKISNNSNSENIKFVIK